ncbi:16380_t:CDS:2, partial [Acaulospora morrowiae]
IDNDYCGEHLNHDPKTTTRERILCPYDLSHTVYKDDLEDHLKHKCNSRPQPNPPYFSLNINCTFPIPEKDEKLTLSELSKETLEKLIYNVNNWFDKLGLQISTLVLDHDALREKREILKNGKHAIQQASLLGHMARLDLLKPDGCFVEFGSGKGELSYFTKLAIKDDEGKSTFILIDRKNTRCKFDSGIRKISDKRSTVRRIGIDIKDVDFSKLDLIKDKRIVAYSKHLCGSATDVTLRSLVNYVKFEKESKEPVSGIIIALCCHQLCQYHMYPNQEYLREIGITESDFKGICAMSSWAICGQRSNHDDNKSGEHEENNSNENDDVEDIGEHAYYDFDDTKQVGQ